MAFAEPIIHIHGIAVILLVLSGALNSGGSVAHVSAEPDWGEC